MSKPTLKQKRAARVKGIINERRSVLMLVNLGYDVETPNRSRFSKVDFFGRWDLMAVKDGEIVWVQVKTNKKPGRAYVEFLKDFKGPGSKQLWVWKDGFALPMIHRL